MTVLGLIADLIKGFQQGLKTLEKDTFVLNQFLNHDHRLLWQFSDVNEADPELGGGYFAELRVLTADEEAEKLASVLEKELKFAAHDWEKEPIMWVES